MSQSELLSKVVAVLDAGGVEYMVTGSLVSSSQGQPRATHDIDLIVNITPSAAMQVVKAFPSPEYYLDEVSVREAVARRDMFNLLQMDTGDKVDFWILKDDAYDQERFARRVAWDLGGVSVYVSRPEDTVIQKLRWAEMSGGSEKQFNDAKAVYELQFTNIDMTYVNAWAEKLELTSLLDRLKRESEPLI